ncbi:hypothetical protein RvY_19000 [Ramazzottius varieornatus]|uniref:Enolase n=1 Tax=Ramazzottius varieornatus TaxID=947166 RepID=A0A1D1WAD3_RAMVA|nr:hypothetical protein RvY_19000 [Ramazzottius varieornatus]
MSIRKIVARMIFDSRGNPTVEVDLTTDKGTFRAAVPSGASTGTHEAVELRDEDKSNFLGKGVSKALKNITEELAPKLIAKNLNVTQQSEIDQFMIDLDGTKNKGRLGANAILGISMAVAKAAAAEQGMPLYRYLAQLAGNQNIILPVPSFNVINGGSHAGNRLAMQEFMVMPTGASTFTEAMKMGSEIYHNLKKIIQDRYGKSAVGVGDEGGFAPDITEGRDALQLIKDAVEKAGYSSKVQISMDPASSEFWKEDAKAYDMDFKNKDSDKSKWLSGEKLADLYKSFIKDFGVISIEDPFEQDDWETWVKFTADAPIQVMGDDLTVTNPERIQTALDKKACNCLLLKVNQIGSVTESIKAAQMARSNGWGVMVSHRSGETEDSFIADLVVGLGVGQIKSGAPCRSERLAKYNQLLRIEEELGSQAKYAGKDFRNPK